MEKEETEQEGSESSGLLKLIAGLFLTSIVTFSGCGTYSYYGSGRYYHERPVFVQPRAHHEFSPFPRCYRPAPRRYAPSTGHRQFQRQSQGYRRHR